MSVHNMIMKKRFLSGLFEKVVLNEKSWIQSVLFAREKGWTVSKAKEWLKKHHFKSSDVHKTDRYIRFRQFNPTDRRKRVLTFSSEKGIKAIAEFE